MMPGAGGHARQMNPKLALVGMAKETARLRGALADGEPLLVLGAAGSGKTRLLGEAMAERAEILYVAWEPALHGLLMAMARALIAARHADFLDRARLPRDSEGWLRAQRSIRLKGLLWSAIENAPQAMVIDGIAGGSFAAYRFLQRIYHTPGMALFAASRDAASLGVLARLFWNPTKVLTVSRLNGREAGQLFETAADNFRLRHLDLPEFREKVLESAGGNPGQIIEMCRLASQPQYVSGRHVKFALLRIDTIIKFASSGGLEHNRE